MKKIFVIILLTAASFTGFGQTIKASIGIGSQPNRVKIYLMPDVTQPTGSFSTLQFNIGVDTTGLTVAPVLTVVSSAWGLIWTVGTPYKEGAYWNYNIYTSTSPLPEAMVAN